MSIVQSALCATSSVARQRPTLFFFPSLRAAPVWSLADLRPAQRDAIAALADATPAIAAEYDALASAGLPSDYSTKDASRQDGEHRLHDGQWDWHSYVKKGERQAPFAAHCPRTAAMLEGVPGLMTGLPFGFAFFSTLHARSSIAPHTAPCNLRVRCHLPLRTPAAAAAAAEPPACGIEIARDTSAWIVGQPLLFDDSYEHRVWNHTDEPRVLLLFDLWHPDLADSERAEISEMFERAQRERAAAAAARTGGA